jgi:DNA mismatch endonuclease (patch repair protein)
MGRDQALADTLSREQRSRNMASIRSKDTQPEMAIRRGLHARGFRYGLHSAAFPGKPDLVLTKYRTVIWIHGCYWHGHDCGEVKPASTNKVYWGPKIEKNRTRDARNRAAVEAAGWRHLTIWECAFRRKGAIALDEVVTSVERWLREGGSSAEINRGRPGPELRPV